MNSFNLLRNSFLLVFFSASISSQAMQQTQDHIKFSIWGTPVFTTTTNPLNIDTNIPKLNSLRDKAEQLVGKATLWRHKTAAAKRAAFVNRFFEKLVQPGLIETDAQVQLDVQDALLKIQANNPTLQPKTNPSVFALPQHIVTGLAPYNFINQIPHHYPSNITSNGIHLAPYETTFERYHLAAKWALQDQDKLVKEAASLNQGITSDVDPVYGFAIGTMLKRLTDKIIPFRTPSKRLVTLPWFLAGSALNMISSTKISYDAPALEKTLQQQNLVAGKVAVNTLFKEGKLDPNEIINPDIKHYAEQVIADSKKPAPAPIVLPVAVAQTPIQESNVSQQAPTILEVPKAETDEWISKAVMQKTPSDSQDEKTEPAATPMYKDKDEFVSKTMMQKTPSDDQDENKKRSWTSWLWGKKSEAKQAPVTAPANPVEIKIPTVEIAAPVLVEKQEPTPTEEPIQQETAAPIEKEPSKDEPKQETPELQEFQELKNIILPNTESSWKPTKYRDLEMQKISQKLRNHTKQN